MPRGDGTGPWGLGPMTGRAAGLCAGYPIPGFANPIPGRGFFGWGRGGWPMGRGRGRGFGMGRGWWRGAYPYLPFHGYGSYAALHGYPGYAPHYHPAAYGFSGPPQLTKEQQLKMLKEEASALKGEIEAIEAQMKELEKTK